MLLGWVWMDGRLKLHMELLPAAERVKMHREQLMAPKPGCNLEVAAEKLSRRWARVGKGDLGNLALAADAPDVLSDMEELDPITKQ